MIIVDAIYINQGGGKALLTCFINALINKGISSKFHFLLDDRLENDTFFRINTNCQFFENSEKARIRAYRELGGDFETVFCFANIPPPLPVKTGAVVILFHNTLLLSTVNTGYSWKDKALLYLKRFYIRLKKRDNYIWVVQTNTVATLLSKKLCVSRENVKVLPFFDSDGFPKLNQQSTENYDKFLYVADGLDHKNHDNLLSAWQIIYKKYNCQPELHLTIPAGFSKLIAKVNLLKLEGLTIQNHGRCNHVELEELYRRCNFLVFPSFSESFGLPLIEGVLSGCSVIASDLPYVYDIIRPSAVFNPFDPEDLAKVIYATLRNPKENQTVLIVQNQIDGLIQLLSEKKLDLVD